LYCVFLETRNDTFLSSIIKAFCEKIVRDIIFVCKKRKGLFVDSSGFFDPEVTKKQLPALKNAVRFLNCSRLLKVKCTIKECEADHITALSSGQLVLFQSGMRDAKTTIMAEMAKKNNGLNEKERAACQMLFNSHLLADVQQVEELKFKGRNPDENVRLHAKNAAKMRDKADDFVYVRSKDPSDFADFDDYTDLPVVTPCDNLQAIP
jgi:hypothetical protein